MWNILGVLSGIYCSVTARIASSSLCRPRAGVRPCRRVPFTFRCRRTRGQNLRRKKPLQQCLKTDMNSCQKIMAMSPYRRPIYRVGTCHMSYSLVLTEFRACATSFMWKDAVLIRSHHRRMLLVEEKQICGHCFAQSLEPLEMDKCQRWAAIAQHSY